LRVIQQTQKRLFEILALLCRLDLIIEFDFTIRRVLIPKLWQAAAPLRFRLSHQQAYGTLPRLGEPAAFICE
jgi:hypothetical protein